MDYLDERKALNHYVSLIDADRIAFLKGRAEMASRIRSDALALRDAQSLHDRIQVAKSLWKNLFEASMTFIDPDRRGFDALFAYFDRYVEFEELIFASDSFYRDHTLHCLWVYFLGEWITTRDEFAPFVAACEKRYRLNIILYAAITGLKGRNNPKLDAIAESIERDLKVLDMELVLTQAQRCVAALTHDLGYPLKKIAKINKAISGILPAFSIRNFAEFSFDYTPVQLSFIDDFLKFVCLNFKFTSAGSPESEAALLKMFKVNDSGDVLGINEPGLASMSEGELDIAAKALTLHFESHHDASKGLRYTSDFEQYEHGIMSAFLLMKTLEAFRGLKLVYTDFTKIDFDHESFPGTTIKREILVSIIEHTNSGYRIKNVDYGSSFLVLMDELEEFSRISRASQSRQFVEEFCKTNLYMEGSILCADFVFDNEEIPDLDPERAFKGKAKRMLSILDAPKLAGEFALRIRFVGKISKCRSVFELLVADGRSSLSRDGVPLDAAAYLGSREFAHS
jgi:hypothetical protein